MAKKQKPARARLLVFADLHADNNLAMSVHDDKGVSDRLRDAIGLLRTIWRRAEEGEVDGIVFLGDLFNRPRFDAVPLSLVSGALWELQERHQIPFFILPGNHDVAARRATYTSVDLYHEIELPHSYILRDGQEEMLPGPTTRDAVSFLPKRYDRPDEAEDKLRAMLERAAKPSAHTLLLLHHDIQGGKVGAWSPSSALSRELLGARYSLTLSGHYHQPQAMFLDGTRTVPELGCGSMEIDPLPSGAVIYAGAPHQLDFGDAGGARGFWFVEVEGKRKRAKFVELAAPRFATADFTHESAPEDVARRVGCAEYIRLRVTGPRHALEALERAKYERAIIDAMPLGPRAIKWELFPEAHHTARLDVDTQVGLGPLLQAYVESDAVQTGGLDERELLKYGRAVLEEVRP